jgi:hypothetical protein
MDLSDTENYQTARSKTHYNVADKNNDVSSEGLDIGLTLILDNYVCLDLHNDHYSIYIWTTQMMTIRLHLQSDD